MKDVSGKIITLRTAVATAFVRMLPSTLDAIRSQNVPKADPVGVARLAGIQAAKQTSVLIPYCHQIPLEHVTVECDLQTEGIHVTAEACAIARTGVEMEALVGASAAALTLYDMLKAIDKSMVIEKVCLEEKTGGKSSFTETGKGYSAAILVLSDSVHRRTRQDVSGPKLAEGLARHGIDVRTTTVLPDDRDAIAAEIRRLADVEHIDLVCTTGGTGTGPRDVTPEATLAVIERRLDGVEETVRRFGQDRMPHAMLSRGVAGIRGNTVIINFPGSPRGVEEGLVALFPALLHIFRMMRSEPH
jgi:cyclic pyranopterin monophosphate synthase